MLSVSMKAKLNVQSFMLLQVKKDLMHLIGTLEQ